MKIYLDTKKKAALLSVISNSLLIVLKIVAGIFSGSISIISEAIHSMSDLLASCLAFYSVSQATIPADTDHPYGHGKYEDFSGLIEGILIILASFFIIYEACKKIIEPENIVINADIALYIMIFSIFANIIVSYYLFKVARKTDSIAIFADAEHLRTDVYSAMAVILGLIIIKLTQIHILDSIIAIIVAVMILYAGCSIFKKATKNLLDTTLPDEEIKIIENIIKKYSEKNILFLKSTKTRKSGMYRQIELILLIAETETIGNSHILSEKIEQEIAERLSNSIIIIHFEPIEQNITA